MGADPNQRESILRDVIALALHLIDEKRIPVDSMTFRVSHSVGATAKDDEDGLAELGRIAAALGVEVIGDNGTHFYARKSFGTAQYEAYYITRRHMNDYEAFMATRPAWNAARAAFADVAPPAGDAVVDGVAAPSTTAPDFELGKAGEHYMASGTKGDEPGDCGAECVCGFGFYGFDTLGEAVEHLDRHIANPDPRDVVDPFHVLPDEPSDNSVHGEDLSVAVTGAEDVAPEVRDA